MEQKELDKLCKHIPGLVRRLGQMCEALSTEDYDGILLITYPRMYNLVPKQKMREKLYEALHNEEIDMSIDQLTVNSVGKLIDHEEGKFVKIDYTVLMALRFKEDTETNQKKRKAKQKKQFLLETFYERYGRDNIWFNETTLSYCFYVKNMMVGFLDEVSPHWTFLTLKKGLMMEAFLPDDVRILFEAEMD